MLYCSTVRRQLSLVEDLDEAVEDTESHPGVLQTLAKVATQQGSFQGTTSLEKNNKAS